MAQPHEMLALLESNLSEYQKSFGAKTLSKESKLDQNIFLSTPVELMTYFSLMFS